MILVRNDVGKYIQCLAQVHICEIEYPKINAHRNSLGSQLATI